MGVRSHWTQKKVLSEKLRIKDKLDLIQANDGDQARLSHILTRIAELDQNLDPESMLSRFIYVVSALYHHARMGGLRPKQVSNLEEIGHGLLRINRVKPRSSLLSHLYSDLFSAMSQVHLIEGKMLDACWEKALASRFDYETSRDNPYHLLGMGLKSFRNGNGHLAEQYLTTAQNHLTGRAWELCFINRIKVYRLTNQISKIEQCKLILNGKSVSTELKTELMWEDCLLRLAQDGDPRSMLALVKRNASHHQESYLLETQLWLRAVPSMNWIESLPKIASWQKNRNFCLKPYQALVKFISCLEFLYDKNIPLDQRLNHARGAIAIIRDFRQLDKELLAWLGLSRWLVRVRAYDVAAFTFEEYRTISLKLSRGTCQDALGVGESLVELDWMARIL
ncbi:hypothetical protein [Pseudobacteriovorax antillogorgiicola]|uniref:Uncharacterized protein n=1 Tax=Pseudobacteriovorax antillogorgiicola TaxID=1513793 RepID=A0A1Y6CRN2_9BACT|nr:hypothetical protein [Pseudobacteriovorax antillogorgiicola]TCS46357.1 hypothetical protein EDD56_12421 [Pseudobacteriovorax antillogorgiicola]SMF68219.1 hypothetical protein SAMN06296036_12421 [Pseudobacteriovorax antillogorgiicola]